MRFSGLATKQHDVTSQKAVIFRSAAVTQCRLNNALTHRDDLPVRVLFVAFNTSDNRPSV